jgi:uncharacterized membrane protein
MIAYLLASLIGVVAGLRAFLAPAAVSWAAHLGWLRLDDTWLAFLGQIPACAELAREPKMQLANGVIAPLR